MPSRPSLRALFLARVVEDHYQARMSAREAAARARSRAQESLARLECSPHPSPVDVGPADKRERSS